LRQLIRLVYHADGALCPITCLMHLAAAVQTKPRSNGVRPCVVIAGGREPVHWEAYPGHQFIHTIGALPCCARSGWWRDRLVALGDGDPRDQSSRLCVDVQEGLPRCLHLITAEDVIGRIETYYKGGALRYLTPADWHEAKRGLRRTRSNGFEH